MSKKSYKKLIVLDLIFQFVILHMETNVHNSQKTW